MNPRWWAAVGVAMSLAGSGGLAAGRAPAPPRAVPAAATPQPLRPTFRSQANYVLVDVRVRNGRGQPVTGLTESEFRVFEDGVPQTITSFTVENVDQLATAAAGGGAPPTIDLATLPPQTNPEPLLRNHRLIVLFFDLTSMPPDDLLRVLGAAKHFVTAQMTPADLVAIATYASTLKVDQNFTNDRAALDRTLDAIRTGEASALSANGSEGDAGGTNASGEEIVNQDVSAAFTPDETEFNLFNTDEKLMAIESLAGLLRNVPGRKEIIHFSSGVTRTGVENEAQLRAAVDAANLADASLYTFDARGLVALAPGGDASSASPSGTALYSGQAFRSETSSLDDSRETLATLAADTGGRSFTDLNDFSTAFADVQRENSTYYLLAYSPTNTTADGKFRRIRVEVLRKGVHVQARPGYFAPKSFRQLSKADKDLQLAQALALDTPFVDLPIAVEAAPFRAGPDRFYVVLAAKIPGSAVPFPSGKSARRTALDFAWRATDASGRVVAELRDTLPVRLDRSQYQQMQHSSLVYRGGFLMPAGAYTLKVAVRENDTGQIGTFEQPLDLPASQPPLSLSAIVLANELQVAPPERVQPMPGGPGRFGGRPGFGPGRFDLFDDPLVIGRDVMVPSVTRVFRVGQTLFVRLESYAAGPRAAGDEPLPSAAVVFFRGGVQISEAGPVPGRRLGAPGRTGYFLQIPLDRFPAGRYTLQVNVLDPAIGHAAFARVPLVILPALPPPAAGAH